MTRSTRLLRTLSVLLLTCSLWVGCDLSQDDAVATLTGTVVDPDGDPIAGADVVAADYGASTQTDGQGAFTLEVVVDSTRATVDLSVFADGYVEALRSVAAFVDQVTPVPQIVLQPLGGGGDGGGGPDDGADEPSGPAASITLLARSSETIGVQSAGSDETATLTFVVLDAFGNPVDTEHAVEVGFRIASGPGGGELLAPTAKETNASGRVQTTLSSGTRAGTVQVIATATAEGGQEIRSLPVVITITGGLPDAAHFSVAPLTRNFPGYDVFGLIDPVTAFVGDRYGNPVQPGTAVYFTTNAGIIEGSGLTDALGRTTVELVSAEPRSAGTPPAECPSSDSRGYGNITARTADDEQQTIEAHTMVLFSGESGIALLDVDADPSGLGTYAFRVADRFGHPLGPGTTIRVAADGDNVEAVGDTEVELGDYLCPGPGRTTFGVAVVEGDEVGVSPRLETITITVRSVNGDIQLTLFNEGGARRVEVEAL